MPAGSLDSRRDKLAVGGCGCGIDHFELADTVGFRFGLCMKTLDGRGSNRDTCEQG
jgi:hypothetical protein